MLNLIFDLSFSLCVRNGYETISLRDDFLDISKDKRENRIHNHRQLFLLLLYMDDRLVFAKQWPSSR